jgi:hypothetical protein
MRKLSYLILIFVLALAGVSFAQEKALLLNDFEGQVSGGPEGTVDFGSGNGSAVEVTAATDITHSGKQSLKVKFDAVSGGYMYIAKGFGLDAKNAAWMVKQGSINWKDYNALAFYMYGSDSKARIAIDVKDNGNELWRYIFEDNFKGWKQIVCPFSQFFARGDWQPQNADKNATMDFPLKSYQFEPLPIAKGTLYFDDVELVKQ